MKKIFKPLSLWFTLSILVMVGFNACKKDKNNYGTGAPVITKVRTLTKNDSVLINHPINLDSSITYPEVRPMPFDSTTNSGKIYTLYAIIGKNLGTTKHIYINDTEIYFNIALATDNSIIFSIPETVPFSGSTTSNKLKLVTSYGQISYDFVIEQPFPGITDVDHMAGNAGDLITITGTTFDGLSSVKIGTTSAEIVSKTSTKIVAKVPAGLTGPGDLSITTTATLGGGTAKGPIASNGINLSIPNNNSATFGLYPFGFSQAIYEDGFKNGWSNYGWSNSPDNGNTSPVVRGTSSIKVQYAGGYDGYVFQAPGNIAAKSFKMSVYGGKGSDNKVIHIVLDYNFNNAVAIVLKEGAWTNFNIPLTAFVNTGATAPKTINSIIFQEFSGTATLFYLDDVGLIQ
ncbi:IPT/TIG domain-containing protein [Mucilaginibacter sp. cycad4]|uniref:IPT/TIG domain-containing protein n=1 Tax=Mucilaginibacter sp. cycad4 TaxID=3342096 RepID=UPI002AAADE5D|nr:IPT/TIG domain-containing protein [Mucilaginibacter gossypii]WPU97611.1 IPT/TIG domain-containing protein [Mucilaginibacter gossypii]